MLKRNITYETFDGETVTDVFYFNLTQSELVELQSRYGGSMKEMLQSIVESKDIERIISEFKKIIMLAYGVKSEDGKRFIKNEQLREEFSQTAAYDSLFMELAGDEGKAAEFINGIMPKQIMKNQSAPSI